MRDEIYVERNFKNWIVIINREPSLETYQVLTRSISYPISKGFRAIAKMRAFDKLYRRNYEQVSCKRKALRRIGR